MSKRTLTVLALSGGLVLAAGLAAAHVVGQHGGWHGRHFAQMGMMGGHHGRMGMMGRGIGGGGAQGLCEGAGREGWKAMRDGIKAGGATFDQTMAARNDCFAKLDSNKDGALDAAEVTAALSAAGSGMDQRMIAMMDVNGDGKLSKDEFLFMAKRRAAMMQRMQGAAPDAGSATAGDAGTAGDSGGMTADSGTAGTTGAQAAGKPHRPSPDEILKLRTDEFDKLDTNKDGFVDQAEMAAGSKDRLDYWAKHLLHRFDANKDGKITLEEFDHFAKERFAANDLNDDGKITVDELPPMMRHRFQ